MGDAILFTVDEGLARLTLNRPSRLNAFNSDLAHDWRDATAEAVARDDVRAILLDAAGPAFCAGGDVIEMSTSMAEGSALTGLAGVINAGIRSLTTSAKPVVAAAHGTTAGGGLGILLCSDYAVVGSRSKLGSLYANIGLTPDLSVSAQLALAVGERRALQLVLQDRLLTATEAVEWGLVAEAIEGPDAAAEADAVRARAEQIARFWLDGAAGAYGQAKRLVRARADSAFDDQLDDEARTIGASFDTEDARVRVAAFASRSSGR
ncbi:MAG: enoyl-CoA hydratase/isomerase family protein [Microbacterium sp.]